MAEGNLNAVITSPVARKLIYTIYVIAGVIIGATQVAFAATASGQPDWLTVALAVLAYLSIPIGGLALVNVNTTDTTPPGIDPVDRDPGF